jgi:hypothetical protein
VIWVPDNADVSSDSVFGRSGDFVFLILPTDEDALNDELREDVLSRLYGALSGTKRGVRVANKDEGYVGAEKAVYEELFVRTKVTLRTQKNYCFTYLIQNDDPNCQNTLVTVGCEGKNKIAKARELALAVASSYQRNADQMQEVKDALYAEAKTGRVDGEVTEESSAPIVITEETGTQESSSSSFDDDASLLKIDAVVSIGRDTKDGDVLVFYWENEFAEPISLGVTSPSGEELEMRPESEGGFISFSVPGGESGKGWHVHGYTERALGAMAPLLFDAEEYANTFDF